MSKWFNEKKMVLDTALRMEGKGLIIGTSGNVSLRLPPEGGRELLAITPTSCYCDLLTPDDIQVIDFEAEPVEGNLPPSSETMMHINLYQERRDIRAVIHTHSAYASVLAVAHLEIPPILEDQVLLIGGEIKLALYAPSGSEELARNVLRALEDRNAALLMNHGAVGVGKSLRDALTVCELIEKTARVYYLCLTSGKTNLLPADAIESGKAYFRMRQKD